MERKQKRTGKKVSIAALLMAVWCLVILCMMGNPVQAEEPVEMQEIQDKETTETVEEGEMIVPGEVYVKEPARAMQMRSMLVGDTKKTIYNSGGADLTDVLGVERENVLNWLGQHVNDDYYLGTPYVPADWRSPNGDTSFNGAPGMNCTGFVWHVLRSAGANENTPGIQGWVSLIANNRMEYVTYTGSNWSDVSSSVAQDGICEPGDVIWIWDMTEGDLRDGLSFHMSPKHHVAIFIGTYFDQIKIPGSPYWQEGEVRDRIWHSSDDNASGAQGIGNVASWMVPKEWTGPYAVTVLKMKNRKGNMELRKTSENPELTEENDSYSLEGAEYGIYSGDTMVASVKTNHEGYAKKEGLPIGTYLVKELTSPKGFMIDTQSYELIIKSEETTQLNVQDIPQKGVIELQKEDAETGKNVPQGAGTLKGAVYDIFVKSDYQPGDHTKSESYCGTLVTDEKGAARSEELPLNEYYVVERQASKGYLVDSKLHEVELTAENPTDHVFTKSVMGKEQIIRGNVEIIKVKENAEEDDDTLEGLEGVEFTFQSDTTGEVVKKIVTDRRGYATTADEKNPNGGLVYDTYTVTETRCPEGFKPVKPFRVTIKEEGVTLKGIYKEDKLIISPVAVVKVDKSTGKNIPLAGTEFRLLDKQKKPITMTTYYPEKVVHETFQTDEKGQFTFPAKLQYGTYYLEEVKAPQGYLKGELLKFEVTKGAEWGNPLIIRFEDENAMGQIRITKFSEDRKEKLDGAVFEIRAAEDIVTPDGTVRMKKGELADTLITERGEAVSKELYFGKYEVLETKQPEGFVLDKQAKIVELSYQDQETAVVVMELEITNKPIKPEKPEEPETPEEPKPESPSVKTGDGFSWKYVMVVCASGGILLSMLRRFQKRR